tara:strand:+ start:71 stop:328 length:258 start_codon:yes stop_codon:yes gene_type:complete
MKNLLLFLISFPFILSGKEYYVLAKGGLNVREAPNTNSTTTLLYKQPVSIKSYSEKKLQLMILIKKPELYKKLKRTGIYNCRYFQ